VGRVSSCNVEVVGRKTRGSAALQGLSSLAISSGRTASSAISKHFVTRQVIKGGIYRRSYATVEPFKLADIGEGIAEVEMIQWFVKVGDRVEEFDKICEVQSDKATVEIKAPKEGVITKLYHEVGAMAKVGAPLVDFSVDGVASAEVQEVVSTKAVSNGDIKNAVKSQTVHESLENEISVRGKTLKVLATPAVRHLAYQHKISLSTVEGSGKDGRVTKADLLDVVNGKTKKPQVASVPSSSSPRLSSSAPQDRVEKLKGYNKAMVKKMTESLSIPHFGYCDEVVMDELVKLRKDLKSMAEKKGVKLSYMPFIIKACSLGLKNYPILNSSLSSDHTEVIYHGSHNIGVAVDTPTGLVVPNIKNVQDLTLFEVAEELNRLIELAKINKLPPSDLSGGTFSLSNIGAIGGTYAKPVLVVPEVCIGAIGKMQTIPRFDAKGQVYPANIVQFSWSADHRVVDGASMANFFNQVKFYLEHPSAMIMDTK
jgi:2-oxoisovalerate dehydrogenase E2 component (dihydrolipoyl transacylase)